VRSLSWSPDGTKIVSGFEDYTMRDSMTGQLLHTVDCYGTAYVSWSPDGAKTASRTGLLQIWTANR
ncbi:MAG: hypothetical protein AAF639_15615, partial [Chloroflexota bacterium]